MLCHILEDLSLQGCDTAARTLDLEKLKVLIRFVCG